ncbi:MAG: HlyD family type I secretion periplasmic adaptor subunit [Proteobacteria bacterium]|nr:HlyD family type I secretion periplasmic adaptor subunit [Pseudomonadota bacterium]
MDFLDYQPDPARIERKPVPGKIRWVLYLILLTLAGVVLWAALFKVDRVVTAEGELITDTPELIVQPLATAAIRAIKVKVGDVVEKDQILATLDPTFAEADESQLRVRGVSLSVQLRRIEAELHGAAFTPKPEEGEQGKLQEQVLRQRRLAVAQNRRLSDDQAAALKAKLELNAVQRQAQERQQKILRDLEGTVAKLPRDEENRLRLIDAGKSRAQAEDAVRQLQAEEQVTRRELAQVESTWQKFVEERNQELVEHQVELRSELEKIGDELRKASRMRELITLRAPGKGIVLKLAGRSVGSVLQQAEPFIVLVPYDSLLEAEVNVTGKDIGRIRLGDSVRIKLDAFPFQRHGVLPGAVRVIGAGTDAHEGQQPRTPQEAEEGRVYKTRIKLLSATLRDVPPDFRLLPGMRVRAEIKVGTRSVLSYFLYPIIRALDESFREP